MNETTLSGIIRGEFQPTSRDGVRFDVVTRGKNGDADSFACLAYGNAAAFLQQHGRSGQRVVLQGRLSSEKLETEHYHIAITTSRILSLGDSGSGMDYAYGILSGLASSDGLTRLAKGTAVVNLNIINRREYKNAAGETNEYKTYLGGTLWGGLAEAFERSNPLPMKDVPVLVEGILKPRTYVNRDGVEIAKIDVWANSATVLSAALETPAATPTATSTATPTTPEAAPSRNRPLDSPWLAKGF